ncbi:MAG: AbrB/MazE/SpoVT family DNA-binding domain-containing protein [Deltaproteobacteria bacterium]|nr:AbrB/MazE/SpoVT family DNA-binding domain-containing protein [Deltaproteobacteria bacterium]
MTTVKLEKGGAMPLVKVKQRYQITIPSSIRGKVPLDVGDMLEATISEDGILLKPQTVLDRKKIAGKLRKAFAAINKKSPYARMSDEEIMEAAIGVVGQVRTDQKAGKKSLKT